MCSEKLSGAAMENTLLRCLHSDPERKKVPNMLSAH